MRIPDSLSNAPHPKNMIELEIDELQHGFVELEKCDHDAVVNVNREDLG